MPRILLLILLFFATSCQLRIQEQNRKRNEEARVQNQPGPEEKEVIQPLPDIRQLKNGRYAVRIDGNASGFIKGNFTGRADFLNGNQLIIGDRGNIRGKIEGELEMLHTVGPIRTLKVLFARYPPESRTYPMLNYEDFLQGLPDDSVTATYIIASGVRYDVRQGTLTISQQDEESMQGHMEASMRSESGDSIYVEAIFRAVAE
jgi:hypothetical protein